MEKKQSKWQRFLAWLKGQLFPPPPQVEPPAEPPVEPPGGSVYPVGDELDISKVIWDEPAGDVGLWAIVASFLGLRWNGDGYSVSSVMGTFTWAALPDPNPKQTIGNWWLIARCADGKWHAATMEWLGRGKLGFSGKRWDGSDDTHGCLSGWKPVPGDVVYAMISTCARSGVINGRERSPAVRLVIT